jgi:uncharacterized integral membrane protein
LKRLAIAIGGLDDEVVADATEALWTLLLLLLLLLVLVFIADDVDVDDDVNQLSKCVSFLPLVVACVG